MRLALGTVQFGLNYGVSNNTGQVDEKSALNIINLAGDNNIDTLDTAIAYGDSEKIVGNITQKTNKTFNIITKLTTSKVESIRTQIESSMSRLQTEHIYGVMLHSADDLINNGSLRTYQELMQLKKEGVCKKIGVSVYSPEQLSYILKHYNIDIVQIPLNILDQKFNKPELIEQLKAKKIEVHARSLFLQGLLLMDVENVPPYFSPFKQHLLKLHVFCKENSLTQLEACISFAKSISFVDKFVIGVSSLNELSQILNISNKAIPLDFADFSVTNEALINPSLWPIKD